MRLPSVGLSSKDVSKRRRTRERTDSFNSSPSLSTRTVEGKKHSLSDKTKRLAAG